jgi:uncharacterized protein YkwD
MPNRSLFALIVVIAGLTVSMLGSVATADAASCSRATASVSRARVASARTTTLCLLNRIRRAHGLRPFAASTKLRRAATNHSVSMVHARYFSHGNYIGRILKSGYAAGALGWAFGENIAWGPGRRSSPARIVRAWMNSPPHKHNILTARFRHIGIGIANGTPRGGRGGTYTTDFGARS